MPDDGNSSSRQNGTAVQPSAQPTSSPLRNRFTKRVSTFADITSPMDRRRSSHISDSVDDVRSSFRSSTDDLLLPKVKGSGLEMDHEPSHWHSAPLALAFLPAVGGLVFTDGSAIVTDVTLLALAAVFLNWSVRIPWDWYCSAQSIQLQDPDASNDLYPHNAIIEEEEEDNADEGAGKVQPVFPEHEGKLPLQSTPRQSNIRKDAGSELRMHEITALLACFIFPLVGAWLLHAIRSQLSRPSEGLVSNYNLTIFILGAELRPLSHLIKMVQARTLHLQRLVTTNPYEDQKIDHSQLLDLSKRLDDLESHIADKSPTTNGSATSANAPNLITEVRKSFQPDLDALNRAVRRYEKRATLLTLQTESRLQDLESRMADALTLAAAAERGNASSRRGSAAVLLDWVCAAFVVPVQAGWTMAVFPAKVAGKAMVWAEGFVAGKVKKEMRTAGRSGGEKARVGGGREKGRGGKKPA